MPFYYKLKREEAADRRTAENLLKIRESIARNSDGTINVPERTTNETLLLCTWNIREFDSGKYGQRSNESIYYIAEIISHFDLVAIQEVNRDLEGLKRLMRVLGSWWDYIVTDTTAGSGGNNERGAFVFDTRKVRFGGLSGEIVLPEKRSANKKVVPARQLARTPFICGFQVGWLKFMLCTVHIYYGKSVKDDPRRVQEIKMLSKFLANRVKDKYAWGENLALLGDFNIFDPEDITFTAITGAGFHIPDQFQTKATNVRQDKHFDQIAVISRAFETKTVMKHMNAARAGVYNFFNHVYTLEDEKTYVSEMNEQGKYERNSKGKKRTEKQKTTYYKGWRTHQMSDHYPMWIEIPVDFGKSYLKKIAAGPVT